YMVGSIIGDENYIDSLQTRLAKGKIFTPRTDNRKHWYDKKMAFFKPHIKKKDPVFATFGYNEEFTYYTGERSVMFPHNVRKPLTKDVNFLAWLEKWKVDYFVVTNRAKTIKARSKSLLKKKYIIAEKKGATLLDGAKILSDARQSLVLEKKTQATKKQKSKKQE
ncbi:MAG: hypothetical protein GY854_29140, partial [Deltaproteobacteria bacterium]|nr:hypothetical protein [Deltaproteobacteria bacterium]